MDVSSGLLVAILFVTLLGLGIAHVVMTMADLVRGDRDHRPDGLVVAWTVILLLVYLKLFWHTIDLLNVAEWQFSGFLYVILGPILLFFATSVLLPGASLPEPITPRDHYLAVARRFFVLFALVQVWVIGVDQLLGSGFTAGSALNAAAAAILIVLAFTRRIGVHYALSGLLVLMFVASFFQSAVTG